MWCACRHFCRPSAFSSGAVGYAGYDVVRYTEKLPNAPKDDRQLPDLSFAFYDQMVVFDHITKTIVVVAMAHLESGNLRSAYEDACARIDALVAQLSTTEAAIALEDISTEQDCDIPYESNFLKKDFEKAVNLDEMAERSGEWLKGEGPESDIVVSSRIRLARNLTDYPFISKATDLDRAEIEKTLRKSVVDVSKNASLSYLDVNELDGIDRQFLVERQLISREHAESEGARGVAIDTVSA